MSGQSGPDSGKFCPDGIWIPSFLRSKYVWIGENLLQIRPIFQNLGLGGHVLVSRYMLLKLPSQANPYRYPFTTNT